MAIPKRYLAGLSKKNKTRRIKEIKKYGALNTKDPKAYVGFATNKGVKTRKSSYTKDWNKLFPDAKSIEERSSVTGIPKDLLQQSYNRGLAAWRTGHRVGATQQQWGYARISSFALCGKTHYGPDADLVRKARRTKKGKRWFTRCKKQPTSR